MIAVLLTITLIFILGVAFLSQKSAQYETAVRNREALQARTLAESGMVDFRQKLAKDRRFPPKRPDGKEVYQYTELLSDLDGEPYGGYTITVDLTQNIRPFWTLRVTCLGFLGDPEEPTSTSSVYTEWDLAEKDRLDPTLENPSFRTCLVYRRNGGPVSSSP
jgi:hypothetical protein